jgi:hypothetical protein
VLICLFFISLLSVWTEKKLLYSKLRNIPVNERATTTVEKPSVDKRDASTATEDLGVNTKMSLFLYLYQ